MVGWRKKGWSGTDEDNSARVACASEFFQGVDAAKRGIRHLRIIGGYRLDADLDQPSVGKDAKREERGFDRRCRSAGGAEDHFRARNLAAGWGPI